MLGFYEASADMLGAVLGGGTALMARRIRPQLSLLLHRRALRVFLFAALSFMVAELLAVLESVYKISVASVVVEDVAETLVIIALAVALYALKVSEREEISSLRQSADVDELTALSNRSSFRRAAARRVEFCWKNDLPLACVVLDIDDFKKYNDRWGHEAGDEALRCVAGVLGESARSDDLVARHGGEEFILVMNGGLGNAAIAAERVRARVQEHCRPEDRPHLKRQITISLGVASLSSQSPTLEALIEAADRQMYSAKRTGKNRVSAE